ncbi:hypothetical protein Ae201684P_009777 [Aphanomyces euteiches]|nr:hypothetical protein Ae201684P_009777 [Aphanomyces euteiches]
MEQANQSDAPSIPPPQVVVVREENHAKYDHEEGEHKHDEDESKELQLSDCIELVPGMEIYHVGTAGLKARVLNGMDDMIQLKFAFVRICCTR